MYRINLNKTETHAVIGNDRREETDRKREGEREEREEVPCKRMHACTWKSLHCTLAAEVGKTVRGQE